MTKVTKKTGPKLLTAVGAIIMALLLTIYIGAIIHRAVLMFAAGSVIAALMALALMVLSLIALWAVGREVWFGYEATKLTKELAETKQLLEADIPLTSTGKPDRHKAQQAVAVYREAVQENPRSWQNWQRLGIVLRAAGDNAGARAAIREAIKINKYGRD